ncbi:MAG TPA: hypothetical protein VE891_11825 [Allosphingosinicella sp.]|nr:hypothetical protein [Allosphingosinicella sp.]
MKFLTILATGACLGLSGCVTHTDGTFIDPGTRYRLASVDGRPAGQRGFTISFDRSGGYSASFDCAEHFGRYTLHGRLVLEPGGTAPGACDQTDLKTGGPIPTQESFGAQFLSDQPFVVTRRGERLTLTGRQHAYIFAR